MKTSNNQSATVQRQIHCFIGSVSTVAVIYAALLSTSFAASEWPAIKPTDFQPLTELRWETNDVPMEKALEAIFREPNFYIRYPVLEEYLRRIPAALIERAFDLSVPWEGTESPDDLVAFFIPIWGDRDPLRCWRWVKKLFRAAGVDGHALDFDSWTNVLHVHDAEGVRAAPFWIQRDALMGLPVAIDHSSLPTKVRLKIMKEFANMWFAAFSSWPAYPPRFPFPKGYTTSRWPDEQFLDEAFRSKITNDSLDNLHPSHDDPKEDFRFEIILRRLLVANPELGPTLVNKAPKPSQEFLLLWAKTDMRGMVRWAESLDAKDSDLALRAKALLMSFVDLETRERWLNDAEQSPPEDETLITLMLGWAQWDLEGALLAATKLTHPEAAMNLANSGVYGPFRQPWNAWNSSRYGIRVLSRLDYSSIPDAVQEKVLADAYSLMEQWDSMDVAGAARFGLAYLLRTNYAPRERLIRFFSGDNIYGGEDGMIDRTFCALRVWAVVRPAEMKAWIATLNDAELQKALAWLLQHPWGRDPDEKRQSR